MSGCQYKECIIPFLLEGRLSLFFVIIVNDKPLSSSTPQLFITSSEMVVSEYQVCDGRGLRLPHWGTFVGLDRHEGKEDEVQSRFTKTKQDKTKQVDSSKRLKFTVIMIETLLFLSSQRFFKLLKQYSYITHFLEINSLKLSDRQLSQLSLELSPFDPQSSRIAIIVSGKHLQNIKLWKLFTLGQPIQWSFNVTLRIL